MIDTQDLSVRVSGNLLLDHISLQLNPGHVVAVVGANGAGKSTLLRALSGDLPDTATAVRVGGKPLADWTLGELARRRAVLAQHVPLSFPFTVFEVVMMGRSPHSMPRTRVADHAIAFAALRLVDGDALAGRMYSTLSGGERQRVQLARVLAQVWDEPADGTSRYLLLDEPTASLDLAQQHRVLDAIRRFARRGVGVLVVLHDLNLAGQYADEVVLLRSGRIIACGPPATVLTPASVEATFGLRTVFIEHDGLPFPVVVADGRSGVAATHSCL